MKTGIDMVKDGIAIVNIPEVLSLITGNIYLFERPSNSDKQDIVFNTLDLTNDQLQNGVFNCNIHCPNKSLTINGETDNSIPDTDSFNTISKKVYQLLNDVVGFDFRLYAQNTGILIRDTDGSWYVNIRVIYNSFQNNYQNI